MEWIDPPFWQVTGIRVGGAGRRRGSPREKMDTLNKGFLGKINDAKTRDRSSWRAVAMSNTYYVRFANCRGNPVWESLPAVRHNRVYVINGSAYFSRPGPRVVDSLEILAEIIHPEIFLVVSPDGEWSGSISLMVRW